LRFTFSIPGAYVRKTQPWDWLGVSKEFEYSCLLSRNHGEGIQGFKIFTKFWHYALVHQTAKKKNSKKIDSGKVIRRGGAELGRNG